ncbi:MAG: DUF4368 domain-containing protein [Aristaeellaceae bacterium]
MIFFKMIPPRLFNDHIHIITFAAAFFVIFFDVVMRFFVNQKISGAIVIFHRHSQKANSGHRGIHIRRDGSAQRHALQNAEKERLERMMIDCQKQLAEIEERIAVGDNRRELIEQYTNLEYLTREIVEILIDYIVIGKRIPGTKDVPIEIHWNF